MKKKLLIIIVLIASLTSCTKKPGSINGNVFWKYNDYVGNKPDAGSDVKLYSIANKDSKFETTTDVSGNFKIEEIPPGKYFLIVQSKNTTDSPVNHLHNLFIYSENIKSIFGLDLNKFKKEFEEINQIENKNDNVEVKFDPDNPNATSGIDDFEKNQNEINTKSLNIISKFPSEFKTKLGFYTGYDKSFDFNIVEIREGKSCNENVDFGTTYN